MRIAGGLPGSIVTFPWQVSLQLNVVGSVYKHICGGSIISPLWILSAAHCTESKDLNDLIVRVGSTWHNGFGETIKISRIVDHPEYTRLPESRMPNYDFTLIQLVRPLVFNARTQPIELPDENTEIADGTPCMTSGWGNRLLSYK